MNVSFLEIIQTISAGLGALMTLRAKINADLNLVSVRRKGFNGNRLIIACRNVRVERTIFFVQITLFLCGLFTLYLAPPPFTTGGIPPIIEREMIRSVVVIRLAMTIGSLLLMVLSYKNWLEERIPILVATREGGASDSSKILAARLVKRAEDAVEAAHETVDKAEKVVVCRDDPYLGRDSD